LIFWVSFSDILDSFQGCFVTLWCYGRSVCFPAL
jgi:hypothetical protein